ncbi:HK97 family phage prohead protease [Ahrensia kielensis]|uniref:HK97 family phage prohead protease n=1 Tax=Ahrensia kielensis TaxID=76980 RepID=UPI00037E7F93|nr:HK97 family phage prohead protease [Ahrensia kielensis]
MSLFHKFQPESFRLAPALDLEIKSDGNGRIEGYASTFGGEADRQGDIVSIGAFERTLAEHKNGGTLPAMLWSHRQEELIGRWTNIHEDTKGLHVAGQINMKTTRGREAYEHVAAGDAGAFSIGYFIPDGGRKYNSDGSFTLLDVDLFEVSVVAIPANPRAKITSVKSLNSKSELIDILRDAGLAKAAAARLAAGGWPALSNTDDTELKAKQLASIIDAATHNLRGN